MPAAPSVTPPHSANRHDAGCGGVGDDRGRALGGHIERTHDLSFRAMNARGT